MEFWWMQMVVRSFAEAIKKHGICASEIRVIPLSQHKSAISLTRGGDAL
jgi:hypothetical protein